VLGRRTTGLRRGSARATSLVAAALIGVAGPAAAVGSGCSTPSSDVDGGDLLGVFARDASAEGGPDAAPRQDAGKNDGGSDAAAPPPPPAPDASVRAPIEGVCVTEEGTPNKEIRRVMGRPACLGSQVMEWKDDEGAPRYACSFTPPGVETRAPLPLLVFFPDGDDDPTAVDKKTSLRKLGASFSLSGDPSHQGFVILAVQGRHIQRGKHGAMFDTEYTGPGNVDVATVDHFIGEIAAKGLVDARRVYTLGAAYGGQMAATYAMMRPDRVAAFGAYAADAPRAAWSCAGPPPPGIVVYRACDGFFSCESVERWLRARDGVSAETAWLRLGAAGEEEPSCAVKNKCTPLKSEGNHRRWPKTREVDVLKFFARHALGASGTPARDDPPRP
jgi:poly(3-hydroxybutyrate) depolymerase